MIETTQLWLTINFKTNDNVTWPLIYEPINFKIFEYTMCVYVCVCVEILDIFLYILVFIECVNFWI